MIVMTVGTLVMAKGLIKALYAIFGKHQVVWAAIYVTLAWTAVVFARRSPVVAAVLGSICALLFVF